MSLILAIESSCDETAVAIVRDGCEVLSSIVSSQHDLHAEFAGVVPEIASRAHVERLTPVFRAALVAANIEPRDLDAIAVTHRPGLIGSLLVGVAAAKALAWSLSLPLVGVDHVHAHLYAGLLDRPQDPDLFPAIGLVVSGGHTALYNVASPTRITRLGGTIDDAVGEAFDKAATILGLGHPGGPEIDRLATKGDDRATNFPVSLLAPASLDFSFSGLKTALLYAVRGKPIDTNASGKHRATFERDHHDLDETTRADLAASFQRAAVTALTKKTERAIDAAPPARSILLGGGVSANSRLREEAAALADRRGVRLIMPPMKYCLDNAAMIAGLAHHLLREGHAADLRLSAIPTVAC